MLEFYKGSENLDIPEEKPKREKKASAHTGEGARNASYARVYNGANTQAEPGYARLFINLGKRDGIFPKQLIGLMNANVHHRIEMGRIDLLTNFSYFEVPEQDAPKHGKPVFVGDNVANEFVGVGKSFVDYRRRDTQMCVESRYHLVSLRP